LTYDSPRDYVGDFVYAGQDRLGLILTPEGVVDVKASQYQYYLKDHLGNTRVMFTKVGTKVETLQESHYYPFGMRFARGNFIANDNRYLYNVKELQDDKFEITGGEFRYLDWYDYGARFFDVQLGRWHVKDQLIEKHYNYSAYTYVYNNPLRLIDPLGLDTILINQKSGDIIDTHKGGEDYVFYTKKKKLGKNTWKRSKQLFHALNISGESGGTPSREGDPVIWSEQQNHTENFNNVLRSVSVLWEVEKYNFEEIRWSVPGNKAEEKNRVWRNAVKDNAWMDIKQKGKPYHPSVIGEWSWFRGTLVRYDDYGNILYGSAGRAFGFSNEWLKSGAHINQIGKGGIDAGKDTYSIQRGYDLYPYILDATLTPKK